MVSIDLSAITQGSRGVGFASKAVTPNLTFNIKRSDSVLAADSPASAAAAASKSNSAKVDDIYEEISDTNGMSNFSLLKSLSEEDSNLFQGYIQRFAYDENGNLKSLDKYDVKGMVNTIGAKYAALSYQIENGEYSNAEKAEMQKRLDTQLEEGLEGLSKSFVDSGTELFSDLPSDNVVQLKTTLFDALGMGDGAKSKIKDSLIAIVKEHKDEFVSFLDSEEGQEFLKQAEKDNPDILTDDVALTEAILYNKAERLVAEAEAKEEEEKLQASKSALKSAQDQNATDVKTQETEDTEQSQSKSSQQLYTLEDLSSFGELQSNLNTFLKTNLNKSEEEIGYQLGLTFIKSQDILAKHGASELFTKQFKSGFDDFMDDSLNQFNKALEAKQKDAEETSSNADPNSYKRLDLSVVNQTFNGVVSYYNATGSTMEAVLSGFEMAKNSFLINQANNPNTVRYEVGSKFFDNFYNPQKGTSKSIGAYDLSNGMSYYKRYSMAMQD